MSNKRTDWEEYTLGESGVETGSLVNQMAVNDRKMNEPKKSSRGGRGRSGCAVLFVLSAALLYSLGRIPL